MNLLLSMLLMAGMVLVALIYWDELGASGDYFSRRSFRCWVGQGILVPVVFWLFLNMGMLPAVPPLMPEVAAAQRSGQDWWPVLLRVAGSGFFLIGSMWGAVTFSWMLVWIARSVPAGQRTEFIWISAFWLLLFLPLAAGLIYLTGWSGAGAAAVLGLLPVVHFTLPLGSVKTTPPDYSRAISRLKFGKFNEAEWEVIRELEQCENDFEGWMMLAELYAVQFRDLTAAANTIRDLCNQNGITGSEFAVAHHRLADWHLKMGDDPVAARNALEAICLRVPGTHLERMARLRVNQLPATREEWLQRRKGRTIKLPTKTNPPGPPDSARHQGAQGRDAAARADPRFQQLWHNPNLPGREK